MASETLIDGRARQAFLRHEARHRFGSLTDTLAGHKLEPGTYRIAGDEFLMRSPEGLLLHYRKGEGVTIDGPENTDPRELELWLGGTLRAAIASLNGLLPLHASAVSCRGKVYAFSGASGAGKSTLVAALTKRGLPLFCDDTLVIDPAADEPLCLPGHKRLRLWEEGLALAGIAGLGEVAPSYPKRFASAAGSATDDILPLGALVFIAKGEPLAIEAVAGGERFALLSDDHYTDLLHQQASGMDRAARFRFQASLATKIPAFRLVRPFDPRQFEAMVDRVAGWIEETGQE